MSVSLVLYHCADARSFRALWALAELRLAGVAEGGWDEGRPVSAI